MEDKNIVYSTEVDSMCCVAKGPDHGPAPLPEEGKWVQAKQITDISGYTHGVGWCAPQQGACKLSLNVKNGVIEEALVETVGCSGMTHSAAMAAEILPGKTILEALNTDLVCDAINTAMRELFLQIVQRVGRLFRREFRAIAAILRIDVAVVQLLDDTSPHCPSLHFCSSQSRSMWRRDLRRVALCSSVESQSIR